MLKTTINLINEVKNNERMQKKNAQCLKNIKPQVISCYPLNTGTLQVRKSMTERVDPLKCIYYFANDAT